MLKRLFSLILFVITLFSASFSSAQEVDGEGMEIDVTSAKSVILTESVSGTVIIEKDADTKFEVAGLVRLAPLLVVCRAFDDGSLSKDDVVTVSDAASKISGPTAFLETHEKISAELLLKSAIMINAGDAVYALCEKLCGAETAFVQKMNSCLEELGVDAVYDDINGAGVVLSARDLAKLGKALSKSETFRNYSNLFYDSITHDDGRETELANPNKLLRYLSGCIGIATGSSNEAGYCGVFAVSRNDTVYICVTLGSKNSSERFDLATEMTEYAFASYKTMKTAAKGQIIEEQISVSGGIKKSVDLVAKNDCMLIFRNGSSYEAYAEIPEQLEAPLSTEQTVGKIEYKDSDGNLIGTLELCPSENIEQASFWDNVLSVFRNYLHA